MVSFQKKDSHQRNIQCKCSIISILIMFACLIIQAQNSYEINYSTQNDEQIFGGVLHSSESMFLTGYIGSAITWEFNPLVLKISPEGDVEFVTWTMTDTNGYFPQILELNNNNLMLIGQYGLEPGNDYTRIWIRIIDPDLNLISDHTYYLDSSYSSIYQDHYIIDDGENIVTLGSVELPDTIPGYTTRDFCMSKFSQSGDSLNFNVFEIPNHYERGFDLTALPGTDQYMAVTSAFFIGMPYPQIVRISNDLQMINNRWFNNPELETPFSFNHWLTNSTFIFTALSLDLGGNNDHQIGIYIADTMAHILMSKELGKPDTIDYPAHTNSLEYVNDSTIYIGGHMEYIAFWPTEPSYVELYLIDTNLNLLGYRQFGGDINYRLQGVLATSDGGCLMYASTYSDTNGYHERDIRIFKVPRDSINIITRITTLPLMDSQNLLPYPNPATDFFYIPLGQTISNPIIQIYKADGKKVLDKMENSYGNLVTLDVRNLTGGIYIYRILYENQPIVTGKFIKY